MSEATKPPKRRSGAGSAYLPCKARDSITLEIRHAATVDDLRHALLDDAYDVLHFSGHGDFDTLLFENEQGKVGYTPY
jgi:hypothetical protein